MAYLDVDVLPLLLADRTLILDRYPVRWTRAVRAFLDRHHIRYVDFPLHPLAFDSSE
ncbi:hypothetical protein [Methylocaldum szegediense]|uniref:NadR/Ttd14 AAA domain-containing protein n=1 Tax=Methylocaldum szegediense TaxID=73780 RepID=A0ABN8X1A5_9GAMM|nr:hypothetical protein [Methylocaldum szegediense]CAI8762703.1 protein of unknown function [Methylocaldum szegediense]